MDTRVREYDGAVWFDRLFLYFALRCYTRSEERTIWYPLVQLNDSAQCTMDARMREYDGAVWLDRLFLHLALRRHTRSEV